LRSFAAQKGAPLRMTPKGKSAKNVGKAHRAAISKDRTQKRPPPFEAQGKRSAAATTATSKRRRTFTHLKPYTSHVPALLGGSP
jgi:hypothetical protein